MLKTWFTLEKETKNTVRYQEDTETAPLIGTLYVKKWALKQLNDGSYPERIELTLDVPE